MFEMCPVYTDTSAETTTPLVDSSINDRLVKLHPLVHQMCFEFMWIIVVSYSEGRLFRITNLIPFNSVLLYILLLSGIMCNCVNIIM